MAREAGHYSVHDPWQAPVIGYLADESSEDEGPPVVEVPKKTSIYFDEEDESLSMLEDQIVAKPVKLEKS